MVGTQTLAPRDAGEIDMDRRTFIIASVGMASIGCAMAALDGYGGLGEAKAAGSKTLILIDPTLAESRAYATDFGEAVRALEPIDADVGALWHTRLRHWTGRISGVLRPSDCFVLRTFSLAQGRAFRLAAPHSAAGARPEQLNRAARASAFSIEAALPRVTRGA
jgi:hypothetical protein